MTSKISPFIYPGPAAQEDTLSIIHLKRDLQLPTILRSKDEDDEGYSEGKVVNTRFGSFPHTTLIGMPWGSQVRASKVDTGSRGRRGEKKDRKRKREGDDEGREGGNTPNEDNAGTPKEEREAVAASSGFIHLLPPTPENWTSSLPHRTQVVYTPDYSYILHRICARPGSHLIEAGAGSGSFTHASARAVYSGYPETSEGELNGQTKKRKNLGKVWSFEFHEQRHEKLVKEIQDHGLDGIVQLTHRDVCENGFLVDGKSPNADAIFLDLPAPWLALPHLTRSPPPSVPSKPGESVLTANGAPEKGTQDFVSPLNPRAPVHLCTFSPCIEQVQRTVSVMRHLGWTDISMVEIAQKRFEIRRERVGIDNGAQRGLQATPADVDEALTRLIEVEGNFRSFHSQDRDAGKELQKDDEGNIIGPWPPKQKKQKNHNLNNRETIIESLVERKVYKEGRLVHRTEPEIKTHTSYLVFAVLPMDWSPADEEKARQKWAVKVRKETEVELEGEVVGMSKRQQKKAARQAMKDRVAAEKEAGAAESKDEGCENGNVEMTPVL